MSLCLGFVVLWMLSTAGVCSSTSAPGKPSLIDCRSPDKETFACWWEPGSDGGLPTEYRLYYERENLKGVHECPDYVSAGTNSCFFNKKHTSFWAEYSLTVVATNALGNASTNFIITDVMEFVRPYPPVNITVLSNSSAPSPYLQVRWESPPNVDVKSGWVTTNYELRFKQDNSKEWKSVETAQTSINLHTVSPGATYMIQVRCKIDYGQWSEWSNTTFTKIPKYPLSERPFWSLVFVFSLIPLLTIISILLLKRKVVKQWILPPVPGPKIKGVDVQLLKSGRSEDVINALICNQNFPPMTLWTDQVEEYLLVSDCDEWILSDLYISQKKKVITASLRLDTEIQSGESTVAQSACEETEYSREGTEFPSAEKAALTKPVQPLENSSHVDIQQHDNSQKDAPTQADYSRMKKVDGKTILILNNENYPFHSDVQDLEVKGEASAPDDYSRVKEVDSDVVLLQKHDSADPHCKTKEDHYTEWTNQKPTMLNESAHSKGFCSEMSGSGYVDSVQVFSVK